MLRLRNYSTASLLYHSLPITAVTALLLHQTGRKKLCISTKTLTTVLVDYLTSQQHASVSQGRICTDNFTCCHTQIEVADQTLYLIQSQYTDTGPSADPTMPDAWQGSHWSAKFVSMTRPGKIPSQAGFEPRIFRSRGGRFKH